MQMMLPLWFVLLLCMMSAAIGFFICSMMVIAKHSDEKAKTSPCTCGKENCPFVGKYREHAAIVSEYKDFLNRKENSK